MKIMYATATGHTRTPSPSWTHQTWYGHRDDEARWSWARSPRTGKRAVRERFWNSASLQVQVHCRNLPDARIIQQALDDCAQQYDVEASRLAL